MPGDHERLGGLAVWLAERRVELVAMEATGGYGKPVCYRLEDRFWVWWCTAGPVRKVPGPTTDLSDAEWRADVPPRGWVRPGFVPASPDWGAAGGDPVPQDPGRCRGGGDPAVG